MTKKISWLTQLAYQTCNTGNQDQVNLRYPAKPVTQIKRFK